MRVAGDPKLNPAISLKSVKPLLPPKPMSLRKNASISAYVRAWVMIDRYTPVTRERNASQPNTIASTPGTSMTMAAANQKWLKPYQYQGGEFQLRKTMKSGRSGFP